MVLNLFTVDQNGTIDKWNLWIMTLTHHLSFLVNKKGLLKWLTKDNWTSIWESV